MNGEIDLAAHRRRSDALLRQVDGIDRGDEAARRRGRFGRVLAWTTRLATLLAVGVLAANAWLAWDVFVDDGPDHAPPSEPSYSDLEIYDNAGNFAGEITVRNPLGDDVELLVTVDLYAGEQNVGDVFGSITMKPDSEAVVTLTGFDDYVDYTDARVDLGGWRT